MKSVAKWTGWKLSVFWQDGKAIKFDTPSLLVHVCFLSRIFLFTFICPITKAKISIQRASLSLSFCLLFFPSFFVLFYMLENDRDIETSNPTPLLSFKWWGHAVPSFFLFSSFNSRVILEISMPLKAHDKSHYT